MTDVILPKLAAVFQNLQKLSKANVCSAQKVSEPTLVRHYTKSYQLADRIWFNSQRVHVPLVTFLDGAYGALSLLPGSHQLLRNQTGTPCADDPAHLLPRC